MGLKKWLVAGVHPSRQLCLHLNGAPNHAPLAAPSNHAQVLVDNTNEEAIFEAAMEAGADDIQPVNDDEGNPTTSYKVGCTRRGEEAFAAVQA